jgi:hypothetical protein
MATFSTACGEDKCRQAAAERSPEGAQRIPGSLARNNLSPDFISFIRATRAALLVALAILAGCASTPFASKATEADAKRFESAPNAAIIYLYRPPAPGGGAASTIWVDGRLLGQTLQNTFFRLPARPGRNLITVSGPDAGRLEIDTKADGVYFVEIQVLGESQSGTSTIFRSVAPETGKAAILSCCRMLEAWRPGQSRFNF